MKNKRLKDLYQFLVEKPFIKQIFNISHILFDEPHFHAYTAELTWKIRSSTQKEILVDIENRTSAGYSIFSSQLALSKCLWEAIERICLLSFQKKVVKTDIPVTERVTFGLDAGQVLSPDVPLGWVLGTDTLGNKGYLPAQQVYLNYLQHAHEPRLYPVTSSGAACGDTHEDALLRGIYEVVERDNALAMYLNKIVPKQLDISTIQDDLIRHAIDTIRRYWLDLRIYVIESDIGIPTYMTILIDKTPLGPNVSFGLKSTLQTINGIVGSIEEALQSRLSSRQILNYYGMHNVINPRFIISPEHRVLYWYKKRQTPYINTLINNEDYAEFPQTTSCKDPKSELSIVLKKLEQSGYHIWYRDITLPEFKSHLGLYVYKVFIPGLQSFYTDEREKVLELKRLKRFCDHYNCQNVIYNKIPHPFA